MPDTEFEINLSDMLFNNRAISEIMTRHGLRTRTDVFDWLEKEFGIVRCGVSMSKQYGYMTQAVRFPSKERYVEFCLKELFNDNKFT